MTVDEAGRDRTFGPGAGLLRHALWLAFLGIAWLIDEPAAGSFREWYGGPKPITGELHQLIISLAMFGQALGITVSLILVVILDTRRRGRILLLGAMTLAAGLPCWLLKAAIGRERPLESGGITIVRGPIEGFRQSGHQSFPSGHTATAFALAYGLSRFYPQCRLMAWTLAWGVGVNRVITVRHFPTDVIAGAWLGYTMAGLVCGWAWLWRVAAGLNRLLEPRRSARAPLVPRRTAYQVLEVLLAHPALVVVASLAIAWAGNGSIRLWDRDEPRFATAAREMRLRGDWILPTFNGRMRPDKPVLIYWLMGTAQTVMGDDEFAARFFSGLAGALACGMVYQMGREMFDRRVGLLAAWILALSPMLIVESKLATVDAVLLSMLLVCFWSAWRIRSQWSRPTLEGSDAADPLTAGSPGPATGVKAALAFWVFLALAVLAKGPVAVGIVGGTLLLVALWERNGAWLRGLRWHWGVPLAVLLVAPWCVAVHGASDGQFLRVALGHHVLARTVRPLEDHRGFPGFYAVSLLLMMAPWAWLLPWALREHGRRLWADTRLVYLSVWALAPWLLFELVRTKLVHYYLPAYPALALLLSSAVLGKEGAIADGSSRLGRHAGNALLVAGVLLGAAAPVIAVLGLPSSVALPGLVTVVIFGGGMVLAGLLLRRRQLCPSFIALASTSVTGYLVAGAMLLPGLSQERVIVHAAFRLRQLAQRHPVALWQYCDPSLVYNFGSTLPQIDGSDWQSKALDLARLHGHFVCPMRDEDLARMSQEPNLRLDRLETISHFDLAGLRTRRVHFVAVRATANSLAADSCGDPGGPTPR